MKYTGHDGKLDSFMYVWQVYSWPPWLVPFTFSLSKVISANRQKKKYFSDNIESTSVFYDAKGKSILPHARTHRACIDKLRSMQHSGMIPEEEFWHQRPALRSELLHNRMPRTWEATDNSCILNSKNSTRLTGALQVVDTITIVQKKNPTREKWKRIDELTLSQLKSVTVFEVVWMQNVSTCFCTQVQAINDFLPSYQGNMGWICALALPFGQISARIALILGQEIIRL